MPVYKIFVVVLRSGQQLLVKMNSDDFSTLVRMMSANSKHASIALRSSLAYEDESKPRDTNLQLQDGSVDTAEIVGFHEFFKLPKDLQDEE